MGPTRRNFVVTRETVIPTTKFTTKKITYSKTETSKSPVSITIAIQPDIISVITADSIRNYPDNADTVMVQQRLESRIIQAVIRAITKIWVGLDLGKPQRRRQQKQSRVWDRLAWARYPIAYKQMMNLRYNASQKSKKISMTVFFYEATSTSYYSSLIPYKLANYSCSSSIYSVPFFCALPRSASFYNLNNYKEQILCLLYNFLL